MLHVRLEAWFPLTIQIALNGHEWLDRHGIAYRKCDNAFRYAQVARAANRRYFNALAGVVNPAPARQACAA